MADNINVTAGSGTTVAADDIGGVLHQRVKISQGADGTGVDVSSAAPLQVTLANTGANATAVKTDGSAATQPVSYAATGSGTATGALRVELPTNGTGTIATVGAVTAITNALPAGTNAIGKLAANSGVDIGDVDVTTVGTITPGTAASNLGKAEDSGHTSGDVGVMSLGVRNDAGTVLAGTDGDYIPFSMDASGAVRVTGGGTQYVEDAASAGGETMTLAGAVRQDTIASNTSTDGDYTYLKTTSTGRLYGSVTVDTALPAGTNNIGDVDVLTVNGVAPAFGTGTRGATVQRVTIATDDSVPVTMTSTAISSVVPGAGNTNLGATVDAARGGTKVGVLAVGVRDDALSTLTPVDDDYVEAVRVDSTGAQWVHVTSIDGKVTPANDAGKTLLSKGGSASSSGNNTLVAAGTNRLKVKAFSLTTTSTTAMTCIFQDGASGTELWRVVLQAVTGASTGANLTTTAPDWLFATSAATLLNLNLSSANAVHWSVSYWDES